MKDLQELYKRALDDLDAIDIVPGKITEVTINTRAKRRWGQCKYTARTNTYSINISSQLLQDDVDDIATMNTIIHELLHTCKGCMDHTGKWKELAERVNAFYPEYNIQRCTSAEEKGIDSSYDYKYFIKCKDCDKLLGKYMRKTKIINYLESHSTNHRYMCPYCKKQNLITF